VEKRFDVLPPMAAAGIMLWLGCSGTIEDGSHGQVSGPLDVAEGLGIAPSAAGPGAQRPGELGDLPYAAPAAVPAPLRARTWKLSHAQYAKAVAAFVGVTDTDVSTLESEIDNGVYPNMSASGLGTLLLAPFLRARRLEAQSASPKRLFLELGCDRGRLRACRHERHRQ
jgi:hypothetical protein